jgi:Ca-activated chloride channel family protein
MTRSLTYALITAGALGLGAAALGSTAPGSTTLSAGGRQPQPPTFRGQSDLVRVFVTVTDRDGRLVTNLTRDQFEVRDDGKPQAISVFDNTPQPIRLVVMLDVSGSMEGNLTLLRGATQELFSRLGRDDAARIGTFGRDVKISDEFTRDARVLRTALPDGIDPDAPTPLWRAVDQALDVFKEGGDGRPVVLVLSDGRDSGPEPFGRRDSLERRAVASQAGAIDRARNENVMIYAVGMRSRSARQSAPGLGAAGLQAALAGDMPDPGLARVAEDTGGGYLEIRGGTDLDAAFAQVADELHSQYLIGYAPPKRDGKAHDIDVRVSIKGLKPRARKSYVAAKESSSNP